MINISIQINTEFRPFRMVLSRKESVKMKVSIQNIGAQKEIVSYSMILPSSLSFDKSGFRANHTANIGLIEPGKAFEEYFELHSRPMSQPGTHSINLKAIEHYRNFDFIQRAYNKKTDLIIDD